MFSIEVRNLEDLLEKHRIHFEGVSFDGKGKSSDGFLPFLQEHLQDILTGDPNTLLASIGAFYDCMRAFLKRRPLTDVPLLTVCDFSTMQISDVLTCKDKGTAYVFAVNWPDAMTALRDTLRCGGNDARTLEAAMAHFSALPTCLQAIVRQNDQVFTCSFEKGIYEATKESSAFWNRGRMRLSASEINKDFHSALDEMYAECKTKLKYETFRNKNRQGWNAYALCKAVAPRICPYCNRNPTPVVSAKYKNWSRPELDHFIPRKLYPMFAVSFFNLIPSCHTCNHSKHATDVLDLAPDGAWSFKIRHPYLVKDDAINEKIFSFKSTQVYIDSLINCRDAPPVEVGIERTLDPRVLKSLEVFRLSFHGEGQARGFYHHHNEELAESLRLLHRYPREALNAIHTLLDHRAQLDSDSLTALKKRRDESSSSEREALTEIIEGLETEKRRALDSAIPRLQALLIQQIIPSEPKAHSLGKLKTDCLQQVVEQWLEPSTARD